MADKTQITEIKRLARQGESVNEIKDKLDLAKSTVYYHFKKEVGQKQKENQVKIPEDEEVKGEICGIFAGDGNFHHDNNGHYRMQFFLNYNDEYWKELKDFLSDKLRKEPMVFHNEEKSRTVIRYSSKKLYEMIKEHLEWEDDKTVSIRLKNQQESREFKSGFLRGLIDTDGYKEKKFRRYIYGTISRSLRDNFSEILDELDISHTTYKEKARKDGWRDMHKVRITGDSAEKFSEEVTPRHPKKQY